MAKAVKFKNNVYLDSSKITYKRNNLKKYNRQYIV